MGSRHLDISQKPFQREESMGQAAECIEGRVAGRRRRGRRLFEVVAFMERMGEVARQRRALLKLGDSALKDFGASRADAINEAGKPWWDLPNNCDR
jgi:uncharacterized protein YjiS (DUF1127 family)